MIQELECYFQELDDTIEETKKDYEVENFTNTCKKVLNRALMVFTEFGQDNIIEYHQRGDILDMNTIMEELTERLDALVVQAKVADAVYRSTISLMNSCDRIDSTLEKGKNLKMFIDNEL